MPAVRLAIGMASATVLLSLVALALGLHDPLWRDEVARAPESAAQPASGPLLPPQAADTPSPAAGVTPAAARPAGPVARIGTSPSSTPAAASPQPTHCPPGLRKRPSPAPSPC